MSIPCTNLMGRRAMKYLNSSNLFTSGFPKGIATIEIVHFRIFTVTIPLSCILTELTTVNNGYNSIYGFSEIQNIPFENCF